MRELKLYKCLDCETLVKVIRKSECPIKCCGREMMEVKPNSVDAAIEKHIPEYEINDEEIIVKVNHVMDEDHYIEWICFVGKDKEYVTYLNPGDDAIAKYPYEKGILYAYCNKHGLWSKEIN